MGARANGATVAADDARGDGVGHATGSGGGIVGFTFGGGVCAWAPGSSAPVTQASAAAAAMATRAAR